VSDSETERAFVEAILAAPDDAAPLLIFADWLDEHGRSDLAYACRWMGYRGYRPGQRRRPRLRKPWAWWHDYSVEYETDPADVADILRCPRARLPDLLFRAMTGAWTPHDYHLTWPHAADALALGLKRLRDLTSLDAPPANTDVSGAEAEGDVERP
jgi:uncharacterized protein (TIGR02996 family)